MTGKQKSYLRGLAHELKPVFQVGKDGVNDNMLTDIRSYLNKHELMKVSVLQHCMMEMDEISEAFEECGFNVIQVIGKTIVLYMKSKNAKDPIILPK